VRLPSAPRVGAVVATLTLVPSCAIVPNPSPEELATADYGPVPTKYDLMVERHIQFEYDLETQQLRQRVVRADKRLLHHLSQSGV
jgi:hypothetical protein